MTKPAKSPMSTASAAIIQIKDDIAVRMKSVTGMKNFGKPDGSTLEEALAFTCENKQGKNIGILFFRFTFNDRKVEERDLDTFAQALWDSGKAAADNGEMFTYPDNEKISSPDHAKRTKRSGGYSYRWLYLLNGVKCKIGVDIRKGNKEDKKIRNIIRVVSLSEAN